jgi:CubicO group peptidase (beta-lactamase class C family)
VIDTAAGVLSKATGVEATADSLFQVGSITKVWTTTLVIGAGERREYCDQGRRGYCDQNGRG